jgi:hypothetical protein
LFFLLKHEGHQVIKVIEASMVVMAHLDLMVFEVLLVSLVLEVSLV